MNYRNKFCISLLIVLGTSICIFYYLQFLFDSSHIHKGSILGAPVSNLFRNVLPETNRTYDMGSTTPAAEWKNVYTQNINVSGNTNLTGLSASNTLLTFYNGTIAATSTNPLYVSALTATSTATSTINSGGFTVGTNQFLVQRSSGNIGIGTTTPDASLNFTGGSPWLEIAGSAATGIGLHIK